MSMSIGFIGIIITSVLGIFWAPDVNPDQWRAPEAYRIIFLHVPFAWTSFLAFTVLFVGSLGWYLRRSESAWSLVQTGSDLGLLFGFGVITSGPIWGIAEWGVPWDWADLRLNTFALLTAVALFIVMARRSQFDDDTTRDTIASVGLFGFMLVPITAVATTLYQKRHPGIVIVESESTGLDPAIRIILLTGFISLTLLFIGFLLISNRLYSEEAGLEQQLRVLDGSDEVA
ncbi:MAG: cytochrome c biogenesis protein CcsA [Candidatus Thalassarchaeaceae archaeon]